MYLKEFSDLVKTNLQKQRHGIVDLNWDFYGWEKENKWREVFHEKTG
jgi:hypothetical protein